MPSICLNMIVRNEADRIIRALAAAAPHINSYCIVDTGSTDNTVQLIKEYFGDHEIPGVVDECKFTNFSQARNWALRRALKMRANPKYGKLMDYLLLQDADMELVVDCRQGNYDLGPLGAPAYTMVQKSGTISYDNTRLVRAGVPARYEGVTHEYLAVEGATELTGAYFIDHADGSNRKDKFERDIALLLAGIKDEPDNARYWFYLGQSYRDAGMPQEAARAYAKRIELGGWDEETWNARVNLAAAKRDLGDNAGFISELLEAFNERPQRAEALYDLAKFYRERGGASNASLMFSKIGMAIPKPKDKLFVNDFVYDVGLREEFSICAFYSPADRSAGARVCDDISLDPKAPEHSRALAKQNMFHYLEPLAKHAPTFKPFAIPGTEQQDGFTPMNPSVVVFNGSIYVNVRRVNYTITEDGRYEITGGDGSTNNSNPIRTKNRILKMDDQFNVLSSLPVWWPRPVPQFDLVIGLEDIRLISAPNGMFASACVREQNREGYCEQYLLRLHDDDKAWRVETWARISEGGSHEKNWMPILNGRPGNKTSFMYRPDVMIPNDVSCPALAIVMPNSKHVSGVSGSSQLVPFSGGYLAVLHESGYVTGTQRRYYQHRFAWFDHEFRLHRLSTPFFFEARQIEFCAGCAIHPTTGDVIVSYGLRDERAMMATVSAEDVRHMLWKELG